MKILTLKNQNMVSRIEEQLKSNLALIGSVEVKIAELVGVLRDLEKLTGTAEEGSGMDMIGIQVCRTLGQYKRLEDLFEDAQYSDFF